jgi:hypothetical protein
LKVHSEAYLGQDSYVGNSMHKIYQNFLIGESQLIDGFKEENQEDYKKIIDLWTILSKNHKFFSCPLTTHQQKLEAAENCCSFTKKFSLHFPKSNITRKMNLLGFIIPNIIRKDTSDNICYKFLKVEQAGEKIHQVWNLLNQTRFFCVRNGKEKLYHCFMEYENLLYIDKSQFK